MATEPKLSDRIVFNYGGSHAKLAVNRTITTGSGTKVPLTWHSTLLDENRFGDITFKLKPNILPLANAEPIVYFNKAGLYQINASVSKDGSGSTEVGLQTNLRYLGQTSFEYAYKEGGLTDYNTLASSCIVRILPNQIGTELVVSIVAGGGSGDTNIRGFNYTTNTFDAGAQTGSFVEITYLGT